MNEAVLQIDLLGDLRVRDAEGPRTLPPSKKARALLAYLLVTGRAQRRERLCGLLWDVADDPRGALRWALSRLRSVLDDGARKRVIADRESVAVDLVTIQCDVVLLRDDLRAGVEAAADETLERWAGAFGGELMEDLDFPDLPEYDAFVIAEREETRLMRARILAELCARASIPAERRLVHARARAQVDPLQLDARVGLLNAALRAGRADEAKKHYASARRMFQELDRQQVPGLDLAWRKLHSAPVADPTPMPVAAAPAIVETPVPLGEVGRAADERRVAEVFEAAARERSARVLVLSGEPGIGKTRLVRAATRRAAGGGATIMLGAAYEAEAGRPYGPVFDALGPRPADEPAPASRDALFADIAARLTARAGDGSPLVLVVDDAQWIDPASAELLHYVARTNGALPFVLLLVVRDAESEDNEALGRALRGMKRDGVLTTHRLEPMAAADVEQLVAPICGEAQAKRVASQCGGNPLFALELARGDAEAERPPASVTDAVRDRLHRLDPEAADTLRWASVLDPAITLARLEGVTALEVGALVAALEALTRASLLVHVEEGYRFAHGIVRRVVYADLSEPRRRLMHRRVAEGLAGDADPGPVAEFAHHAALAHAHELAAAACLDAARHCQRVFANADATAIARRGLQHAEKLRPPANVLHAIDLIGTVVNASAVHGAKYREELRSLGERALDLGETTHARRAFFLVGWLSWEGGDLDEAQRHILRSELIGRGENEQQCAAALGETARCLLVLERDMSHAEALLLEADARARSLGVDIAGIEHAKGLLHLHRGEYEDAQLHLEKAYQLANSQRERLLEYHALEHLVALDLERGTLERARRWSDALVELGARTREGSEAPNATTLDALVRYAAGAGESKALDEGFAALRLVDAKQRLAYALCRAAWIDLEGDALDVALARAAEAETLAVRLERQTELLLALLAQRRAAAKLGDIERVEAVDARLRARSWADASRAARTRLEELG